VQENGVATAIESIYRDLEYARSLIKRSNINDEESNLGPTTKEEDSLPSGSHSGSGYSSSGSAHRAASDDWSIISEQDDRRSSMSSQPSEGRLTRECSAKRTSFTAAVLSVLPDSFVPGSPRSRRRSLSAS
jgi:sterol 3beta-glucosyltransferase